MGNLLKIENIQYSLEKLNHSVQNWKTSSDGKYLLRYPTVYIINDKNVKIISKFMLEKRPILIIELNNILM